MAERPAPPSHGSRPLDLDIEDHGEQDRQAGDQVECKGAGAEDEEPVLDHTQHARSDAGTDHGAASPGERGAANHSGGHAVEREGQAIGGGVKAAKVITVQDAHQSAQQGAQHEAPDLDRVDPDSRLPGGLRVSPHGHDVQAEGRPSQHHMQQCGDAQRPEGLGPGPSAQDVHQRARADRIRRRPVRIDENYTPEGEGHSQGGDERGHAQLDGDQAVDQPEPAAYQQREDDAWQHGDTDVIPVRHEKGRYDVHLAHGQIDLAQDQDRHFGERKDGEGCDELGQHQGVVECEEVRGLDREEDGQRDRDQNADQLAQVLADESSHTRCGYAATRLARRQGVRAHILDTPVPNLYRPRMS